MKHFSTIKNLMPGHSIAAILVTAVVLLTALMSPAHAFNAGQGSDTCGGCHGVAPTGGLSVRMVATGAVSNALTRAQGQILTLNLNSSGADKPTGRTGFSIAIYAAGVGNPVEPTGTVSGANRTGRYLTHASSAIPAPTISYTIPTNMAAGTYTVKAVMVAANGDGGPGGDQWNVSGDEITLVVASASGAPGTPTGVAATAGNQQVSVAFALPGGSAPASSYTATCGPSSASGTASPVIVPNLLNDQPVTCRVTASNAAGTSAASAASNAVIPSNRPGVPTNVTATAGNAQAVVNFTPPANTGGSAITRYNVTCGDRVVGGPTPPFTVPFLTNATAYTCSVTATNSAGGTSSPGVSNSFTPAGPPDAPTIGTATAGSALAIVNFSAPNANGSPITGYTATCRNLTTNAAGTQSGQAVPGQAQSVTVTGLGNNLHNCSVIATNAAGNSEPSAAAFVTPLPPAAAAIPPGAPTSVTATPGDRQVTVSYAVPGNIGSSAITGYTAACGAQSTPGPATARSLTVTNLANGTPYTCTVLATNSAGNGPVATATSVIPVAPPVAAPPATKPGAPTVTSVTPGDRQVVVAFTPPGSNGVSAITRYLAHCGTQPGVPASTPVTGEASARSLTVTGLANGTEYTCTVGAINALGSTPSAPSTRVTPVAPLASSSPPGRPDAPTIGTAISGDGEVRVAFTPPASDGGSAITLYLASCSSDGAVRGTANGTASPLTVKPLANGTPHTCKVSARNAIGFSPTSGESNRVIPAAPAGTPAGRADIVFTSPAPTVTPATVAAGGQVRLIPVTLGTMKNQGTAATGPFRFGVYLSRDPVITTSDTFLNFSSHDFNIAAGAQASFGIVNVTIPPGTAPGNYYIGFLADHTNQVNESNESNNYVSAPITIR